MIIIYVITDDDDDDLICQKLDDFCFGFVIKFFNSHTFASVSVFCGIYKQFCRFVNS